MTSDLWHYTCMHSANRIGIRGHLRPYAQFAIPGRPLLVWLTDLPTPDRDALGLTSHTLSCDRTQARYRATQGPHIEPWADWADAYPVDFLTRFDLEHRRQPDHWWVSTRRVAVTLDPCGGGEWQP